MTLITDDAVGRFEALLGADAVRSTPEDTVEFLDPYPFGDTAEFAPGAVVSPSSVEEVQAIVRVANELRVPLWTVSRGKNNAYGGSAPRVAGSVVVELTRMNRVLEVNEESAYAVVEPGVRFFDIYDHLKSNGHKLWASVPELGWGSLIGNGLDRGLGYTPYGEHGTKHCGYEIVLPDGSLVRTGMGAMTNSASWHLYQPGYGPSVDGIFQQSNFGIVVKAGVWLMPEPEHFMAVDISVPEFDDLEALIDRLRPLRLDGTVQSPAMIGEAIGAAAHIGARDPWYDGDGVAPDDVVRKIMSAFGIGRWTLFFGLYGSEARIAADFAQVEKAFGPIPGVDIKGTMYAGDVTEDDVDPFHKTRAGIPGMHADHITEWRAGTRGTGRPHGLLARAAAARRRRDAGEREDPRARRGVRLRLHGRLARRPALHEPRRRAHLGRRRRRSGRADPRAVRPARHGRRGRRPRRVPHAHRVHGPCREPVRLQLRRAQAAERDHQGRGRPQRDPVARQVGDLAT